MKKLLLTTFLSMLFAAGIAQQQNFRLLDSLTQNLSQAKDPWNKVEWLGQLAHLTMTVDNEASKKYTSQMMEIAETSRDRKLIVTALLNVSANYFDWGGQQQSIRKGLEYAQNALEMARTSNLDELAAVSYIYLARGSRANGDNDKGMNYSNLALSTAMGTTNDSVKTLSYISVGSSYLYKKEKQLAFRNYLAALDIAEQVNNYDLLRACYTRMVDFNRSLENYERAKDYQFRLDSIARKKNRYYDVLEGYNSMGGIYAGAKQYDFAMKYYEKSIALADTLQFPLYKLNSYLSVVNLLLMSDRFREALDYFENKKDLRDFMQKSGMQYMLDQGYGSLYTFVEKYDSAAYYFKKAEPQFESNGSKSSKFFFYGNYAAFFRKTNNYPKAIEYWKKGEQMGRETNSFDMLLMASRNLDSLYQFIGDYKTAYHYSSMNSRYRDTVNNLAKEKDLLNIEIENEKKRADKAALLREEETRRRHNLQYMGITAAIGSIFILLVMAGAFSVSARTIKIIGFFAFIFLFEFIILLADNQIHHLTHGEPWMVLAIKIVLIAMLLPLHHWLEEKAVHYLTTKKILRVNRAGLFGGGRKKDLTHSTD